MNATKTGVRNRSLCQARRTQKSRSGPLGSHPNTRDRIGPCLFQSLAIRLVCTVFRRGLAFAFLPVKFSADSKPSCLCRRVLGTGIKMLLSRSDDRFLSRRLLPNRTKTWGSTRFACKSPRNFWISPYGWKRPWSCRVRMGFPG